MSVNQMSVRTVRAGSAAAWLAAVRPRSLLVAISPVLVGAALGWLRTGALDGTVALIVLAASLLVQVVTNLQNDVGYTVRGAEASGTRVGLPRATAHGWLTVGAVRGAIVAVAVAATLLGLWLVALRGWPVLAIGVASLAAALAYMGGPRPIAYTPLGEFTVFVFFGLVAVMGTDWVLTGSLGAATVVSATAIGALAAAALAVNNQRDVAHDAQVGRRTFPVVFGRAAAHGLTAVLLLGPFALTPLIAWLGGSWLLNLPLLLLPAAWALRRDFARCAPGLPYNLILFRTFKLELLYAVLLASGAVLGRLWEL
ncbi:MAG TPA: 1,4-dihydroxy-2-naphthoate octaprenyltransferase [Burkholderiaceae bacterium]|nr:1,4-dihydroxy-2-naphthoate octaprenyltransferase [Burkholderiaceae bacterium]